MVLWHYGGLHHYERKRPVYDEMLRKLSGTGGLSEGVRSGKHWAVHSGGCDLDRHKVGDSDFLPLM